MVGEDWSCEKDVRLVDEPFHIRLEELRKIRSENLSLGIQRGGERRKLSEERVLPVDLITQIVWFGFI